MEKIVDIIFLGIDFLAMYVEDEYLHKDKSKTNCKVVEKENKKGQSLLVIIVLLFCVGFVTLGIQELGDNNILAFILLIMGILPLLNLICKTVIKIYKGK
ncbi:MAG: hypothetical protein ACK5LC_04565 [Coprobacillaceae bacterium]